MSFNNELEAILPQLRAAVEAMMDPSTPQAQRLEAYQACENFKETSSLCAPCGMLMASKENKPVVRHFGLQLLEHCVRFRWYDMLPKDKLRIKENALKLMREGTNDILTEQAHIKGALSRIIVEMIKREWPQQWPNLMQELDELCKCGPTQTELVFLVFLRLAEDVVIFQTVPTKRRREIFQALTTQMPDIFGFFVITLRDSFQMYSKLDPNSTQAQVQCRIAQAAMRTLTGYLDWVSTPLIMQTNGLLLELFCVMLSNRQLQLDAAECLLLVTSRKGKVEDRKPLLVLFNENVMTTILKAVMETASGCLDEYRYLFLKRLCQVLTTLGTQLCTLWGTSDVAQPPNFEGYLTSIQTFTKHPSQVIGSLTQSLWASFLRHEHISQDPVLLAFIPAISNAAKRAFLKVGFPSQTNSISCGYSRFEFDSDEDFNSFYSKYRAEVSETVRVMTVLAPKVTFAVMAQWLDERLSKAVDVGEGQDRDLCNLTSPAFLEWDALASFMEAVMARLNTSAQPRPPADEGILLIKAVLNFETKDPLILSCVLSCISALFPYITDAPDLLPAVVAKIFSTAVFSIEGQTKATRSRGVKNVRRHACSVLVKICKQYPKMLLPAFADLYTHVRKLSSDPGELSQMEKVTLLEALVLISNEFRNFEKQCSFNGEILSEIKAFWLSQDFKESLVSVEKFITYIGIDQPPVEPSSADTCGINRSHMTNCISTITAVMKRSKWPDDLQEAKNGGFMNTSLDGRTILRNPGFPHIGLMLENVLLLLRTLNALWLPENLARRHPDFAQAYDPAETDKFAILGIQPPSNDNYDAPANKHPLTRMQNFISASHDNCYHILGNAGMCLGHEFYSLPNLAQFLLNTVFTNLGSVPNYRIRPILRVFLKPYIQACPKEYHATAVLPILKMLCPFMHERLDGQWRSIAQRAEVTAKTDQDEDPESKEVLEDQLTRLLTREYIELLGAVCLNRRGGVAPLPDGSEETMMEDGDIEYRNQQPGHKDDSLSELGQLALESEGSGPSLIISVFNGLSWGDGPSCNKCTSVAWPILKHMMAEKRLSREDASHLFLSILRGLHQHGEHEGNQATLVSLSLQAYELLRPEFQEVAEVLLRIPTNSEANIKSFDEKLTKPIAEKKKRELFRKLVEEIMGKSISQRFKEHIEIKDLPPLYRRARAKQIAIDTSENTDLGLCALFTPEQGEHTNHF